MPSLTASTSAAELVLRNRLRRSLIILNEDTSIAVFLKRESPGAATVSATDHDYRIGGGAFLGLNWNQDGQAAVQDRWTFISASGTPRVAWFETEDAPR